MKDSRMDDVQRFDAHIPEKKVNLGLENLAIMCQYGGVVGQ